MVHETEFANVAIPTCDKTVVGAQFLCKVVDVIIYEKDDTQYCLNND